MNIPQELTSPEVVEMDFGDCMDFLKNNGSYLDLCWLKNHWRVTWILNKRDYIENDENIFRAVAKVIEKVRNEKSNNYTGIKEQLANKKQ